MSLIVPQLQSSHSVIPDDIFEDIILPDILSQHLHTLLVEPGTPEWHAFYVLPLVSPLFYTICRSLVSKIFGIKQRTNSRRADDSKNPDDDDSGDFDYSLVLDYAISAWDRARRPNSKLTQAHLHNQSTLLEQRSLIGVYTCLALGRTFLNVDVLLPLGVTIEGNIEKVVDVGRGPRSPWDEDYGDESEEQHEPRPLEEANIHRCFMPFDCAQRLCDSIVPERLGLLVAAYMAQVLPLYHSLPLLAKNAQDLHFNVAREYKMKDEEYADWNLSTLRQLERSEVSLDEMMKSGALVRSLWDNKGLPTEALKKLTRIIGALDDVVGADWGSETSTTRSKASALIRQWTA